MSQPGSPASMHRRETLNSGQHDAHTEAVPLHLKLLRWLRCARCCAGRGTLPRDALPSKTEQTSPSQQLTKVGLHTRTGEQQGSLTTSFCIEWTLELLVSIVAGLSSRSQPPERDEPWEGKRTGIEDWLHLFQEPCWSFVENSLFKKKSIFHTFRIPSCWKFPPVMRSIHNKTCGLICLSPKSKAVFWRDCACHTKVADVCQDYSCTSILHIQSWEHFSFWKEKPFCVISGCLGSFWYHQWGSTAQEGCGEGRYAHLALHTLNIL